jgi:hypothetical protein
VQGIGLGGRTLVLRILIGGGDGLTHLGEKTLGRRVRETAHPLVERQRRYPMKIRDQEHFKEVWQQMETLREKGDARSDRERQVTMKLLKALTEYTGHLYSPYMGAGG